VQSLHSELYGARLNEMCLGDSRQLAVTATLKSGETMLSWGVPNGKVSWDSFKVESVRGGTLTPGGIFTLSADPRQTFAAPASVRLSVVGSPSAVHELFIAPRYDCAYEADVSGDRGSSGSSGSDGSNGSDGGPGQTGSSGGSGDDGHNGENGGSGPNVVVAVSLVASEKTPLLKVRVTSSDERLPRAYLIDAVNGSLTVKANGGAGGAGGGGGDGGYGGAGGKNEDGSQAASGSDGMGGNGGNGGNGGPGGRILLLVTPDAQPYLGVLHLENRGGAGGNGGSGGRGMGGYGGNAGRPGANGPPIEVRELPPEEAPQAVW